MQLKTKKLKESMAVKRSIAASKYLLRKETLSLSGEKDLLNLGLHVAKHNPNFAKEGSDPIIEEDI
jgi:hypothetical protein